MVTEQLTDEQVEALWKERQAKKQEAKKSKEESYLSLRNDLVSESIAKAKEMQAIMQKHHLDIMSNMLGFKELMDEFGDLPKRSKGGFSIMNDSQNLKVTLRYRNIGDFDERADLAEAHIRHFLEQKIKTTSSNAFKLIIALLERSKGKLEYSRVMLILKYENEFEDEDWKRGCELLKESYQINDSKYYLEFEQKNEDGVWKRIDLSFSSFSYPRPKTEE